MYSLSLHSPLLLALLWEALGQPIQSMRPLARALALQHSTEPIPAAGPLSWMEVLALVERISTSTPTTSGKA